MAWSYMYWKGGSMIFSAGIAAFHRGREFQVKRFLEHAKDAEGKRSIEYNKGWSDTSKGIIDDINTMLNETQDGPDEGMIGI